MKSETKLFLGIIAATIALVVGAVFLFSQPAKTTKANNTLLVREDSQKIVSAGATVTLVEFSDFQCPACGAYYPLVKQLTKEFADSMGFVYRNFPLQQHQNARLAAQVAEASGKQGKYWEMNTMLFENQKDWSESAKARDIFTQYAESLHLDINKWNKDIDDAKTKIDRDVQDGNALGINATPTFYLDGVKLQNPGSLADFEALIKAAIAQAPKPTTSTEVVHTHFNIVVYLNGTIIDFSLPKYQETNEAIHFHDGKGDLVHIHKAHATLGELFSSLGMTLTSVKMYVNGKENSSFLSYEPQDLDRILITDGSIVAVSDDACIYSEKCPERGKPPVEKCVGGLGTGCTK